MKKFFALILLLIPLSVEAQTPATCFDTTLSATGRALLQPSGGATAFSAVNVTYRTTGTPATLSITVEAGNVPVATADPITKIAAVTTTTGQNDMGTATGVYRYWYANLGTLTGGTNPTVIVTACFGRNPWARLGTNGGQLFPVAPTFSTMTAGSVLFAGTGGVLSEDNTFFFDNANDEVGIGTNAPDTAFHIKKSAPATVVAGFVENTDTGATTISAWKMKTGASASTWQSFTRNGDMFFGIESVADHVQLTNAGNLIANNNFRAETYSTETNCADSAGDAACAAAPAGAIVVDAADTATVVSTTAVTANSQIFLQVDSSLGTRLSVTCNTQDPGTFDARVTARTAATSFTITLDAGPTTNPLCINYFIIN